MAETCRELRAGTLDVKLGNALMFGYASLAKLLQDARDTRFQKRLKKLWDAHVSGGKRPIEPEHN